MRARCRALRALTACLRAGSDLGVEEFPAIADDDWAHVLALANEHLLTPALRRAVQPHRAAVPSEVWRYLEHIHLMNSRRNRFIRRQALELIRALNAAGIEPLLLKGILMTLHERRFDKGARMMADIDFVVPADLRDLALSVLARLGYRPNREFPTGHHAVGEYMRDGDPAAVDLHIELIDQKYLLPAAEVWADASRVQAAGGGTYRVPSPTHRVFHNILHAQTHYRGGYYRAELDLRQTFELAYLARAYGSRIDWAAIAGRMRAYRAAPVVQSYVMNAERLMGTPWPFPRRLLRARFHAWRCRLQLRVPLVTKLTVPWGNLRGAFAWHRMAFLHRDGGGTSLRWRYRHIRRLLERHRPSFFVQRLLRS